MLSRRKLLFMLGPALMAVDLPSLAQSARRIERSQLELMFAQMRARAPWNVDGPLLWGYFFLGSDLAKVEAAAVDLQAAGYRVVEIAEVPGRGMWRLHVERVEQHSPASLDARNTEFYAFAAAHGLESYDGMDVGAAPK